MRSHGKFALLISFAVLWGCSRTVLVNVPPQMDLTSYGTLGIVEFASNSERTINTHATRRFQEQIQAAQPGTPFIELGDREAVLAAVGGKQFDVDVLKKIGAKYGVAAVFIGDITYSDLQTEVKITDLAKLEGGVRAEIKADISSRLVETKSGASVWSSSAWARRQIGRLSVSSEYGVSGKTNTSNLRREMVPDLVYELTHDFRPSSVRQQVR